MLLSPEGGGKQTTRTPPIFQGKQPHLMPGDNAQSVAVASKQVVILRLICKRQMLNLSPKASVPNMQQMGK